MSDKGLVFTFVLLLVACEKQPVPPPSPSLELQGEWGVGGNGPGLLSLPLSLAVDTKGFIYIADAGSGFIHKFNPQGTSIVSFADEFLERPTGIVTDALGSIYVADYASDLCLVFSSDGTRTRVIQGGPGLPFDGAVGVTVDDQRNLFVLEFDGHRIQKFDPAGQFMKSWGSEGNAPGQFHFPVDLFHGPDGFVYVADTHNRRVQKFTGEGDFVMEWGEPGSDSKKMDDITGIAVSEGLVFLADAGNHWIQAWTLDGHHKFTESFGGLLKSELETPTDVALVPDNDELHLLHAAGPRVLRLGLNF